MKKILSLSLGSSKRDSSIRVTLSGTEFLLQRKGTDGNIDRIKEEIRAADGNVDMITLGGIDINLVLTNRQYPIKDAVKIVQEARETPVTDGELYRKWVEPLFVEQLFEDRIVQPGVRLFFPMISNRIHFARKFLEFGIKDIIIGDLIYTLGFPRIPITSIDQYDWLAQKLAPMITNLPFRWVYPIGEKQEKHELRKPRYFQRADIIAGDFHNIKRFLIDHLEGKIIITNTVTKEDRVELGNRKLNRLITFSPNFEGRTFGSNLIEGIILSLAGKSKQTISKEEYLSIAKKLDFKPQVEKLYS